MSTSSLPPQPASPAPAAGKGSNRGFLIAALVGLLVVCVCGMVIALLAAGTIIVPAIVNAGRTPSPLDMRTQWPAVVTEPFANNVNGWNVHDRSIDAGTTSESIANGKLHIEAKANQIWESDRYPSTRTLADMYLAVRGRVVSGPGTARYGLIFRVDTATLDDYVFTIADNGTVQVDVYHGARTNILATNSSAVRPGQANQLAVVVRGSHFVFYVNDQQVAEIDNSQLATGAAGVAFQLDAGTQAMFDFDSFDLRAPVGK